MSEGTRIRPAEATPLAKVITEQYTPAVVFIGRTKKKSALTSEPVWQIIRQFTTGKLTVEEAAGDRRFDQVWDDRDSLFDPAPFVNEYSLDISASNKRVDVPDHPSLDFTRLSPWSWGVWTKLENTGAYTIINKMDASRGYKIYKNADESLEVEFRASGLGDRIRVKTTNPLPTLIDAQWHFLTFTYDGSGTAAGMSIYFDGIAQSLTILNDTLVGDPSNIGALALGANTGGGNYFDGFIDEVCLWNAKLSQNSVTGLYNSGVPIDPTEDQGLYTQSGSLVSYWPFTEADRTGLPTILDNAGSNHGTGVAIVAGNFVTEVAP